MFTMQTDSGSSDVLKIQINVKGQQDRAVIQKSTCKGNDILVAGGVQFFKKRKAQPAPPQPSPCRHQQQPAANPAALDEGSAIAAAAAAPPFLEPDAAANMGEAVCMLECHATGYQEEAEHQDEAMHDAMHHDAIPPALDLHMHAGHVGPGGHAEGGGYAEASLELVQEQLDACLPPSCPRVIAVQFALEKLLAHGAAQLDRSHGTGIYGQAARQVLSGFTELLQQQADGARAMLLQVRPPRSFTQSSGSWQGGAQPGQATPGASPAPGSKGDGQEPGTVSAPLEQYLSQAPMVRELSSGSTLKAQLEQQLAVLQQEEQAWVDVRRRHAPPEPQPQGVEGMGTDAAAAPTATVAGEKQGAGQAAEVAGVGQQAAEGAEQEAQQAGAGTLRSTEESVAMALKLQVESLSAFLTKVEALVAKGEQACMMLQADYHQDKFKTFPHVNSPAWLIRQIISKHQEVAVEAEASGAIDR